MFRKNCFWVALSLPHCLEPNKRYLGKEKGDLVWCWAGTSGDTCQNRIIFKPKWNQFCGSIYWLLEETARKYYASRCSHQLCPASQPSRVTTLQQCHYVATWKSFSLYINVAMWLRRGNIWVTTDKTSEQSGYPDGTLKSLSDYKAPFGLELMCKKDKHTINQLCSAAMKANTSSLYLCDEPNCAHTCRRREFVTEAHTEERRLVFPEKNKCSNIWRKKSNLWENTRARTSPWHRTESSNLAD